MGKVAWSRKAAGCVVGHVSYTDILLHPEFELNKEVNAALADPKLKLRLADLGSSVAGGSAADYGKRLEAEAEKWGKVIRAANIKAE